MGELNGQQTLAKILQLLITDPSAAANELDIMADQLKVKAAQLREAYAARQPSDRDDVSPGGMRERVAMNVFGPDGNLKQHMDTEIRR